jgi:hypothetical protein
MNRNVAPEYFLLHLLAANGGISIAIEMLQRLFVSNYPCTQRIHALEHTFFIIMKIRSCAPRQVDQKLNPHYMLLRGKGDDQGMHLMLDHQTRN